jgi:GNAT superfamily N-acetyltransferase
VAAVRVTTWYLEMIARPAATRPAPAGVVLEPLVKPTARTYRPLYETVGGPWYWIDRRKLSDAELEEILDHPRVEVVRLSSTSGELAGYFELDRRIDGACELAYFGLAPAWIGRGLGSWFLQEAVQRAWDGAPERVFVHTCSLDHPRALAGYERGGFRVYDVAEVVTELERVPGRATT